MKKSTIILSLLLAVSSAIKSQSLTVPRISPLSSVSHRLGITDIKITYSSPQVREREIWNALVPYDKVWRAGADNNTILETSHDITINDLNLPAGKYGLHMIPSKSEWIIILSRDYTSWGSFTYNPDRDQLRFTAFPINVNFQEHLSYQFEERGQDHVVASMTWENISIPFTIRTNVDSLVIDNFKKELRSKSQFDWQAWHQAAQYCLSNNIELKQGLDWVNYSLDGFLGSREVFENLRTKAGLLEKLDSLSMASKITNQAINHPTANPLALYRYGRQSLNNGQLEKANQIFIKCNERFPGHWLSPHGLARAYSALGDYDKAKEHEEKALLIAPERSKAFLEENIIRLNNKEDIN